MILARTVKISVKRACELLKLPRASFYRSAKSFAAHPKAQEIEELAGKHPTFGYRRLACFCGLSQKQTRNLMSALGLMAKSTKRKPRAPSLNPEDAKNLCKKVETTGEILASDFTYIPLFRGYGFFAVTLDLCSRRIRGWAMKRHMETSLVAESLEMSIASGELSPDWIHHSDRGSQYVSHEFRALVQENSGRSSYSKPGTPGDNAYVESFFGRFKNEEIHTEEIYSFEQAYNLVERYVEFYNNERPHSSLGYLTPISYERNLKKGQIQS